VSGKVSANAARYAANARANGSVLSSVMRGP
jgi:hypothetical protein